MEKEFKQTINYCVIPMFQLKLRNKQRRAIQHICIHFLRNRFFKVSHLNNNVFIESKDEVHSDFYSTVKGRTEVEISWRNRKHT